MAINTFFPLVIDSTMLMEFDSCQMSGFRKYLQHLHSGAESTDLVAGAAFAKGLEVTRKAFYNDNADQNEAIAVGTEALFESYGDHIPWGTSVKTVEKMAQALEMYFWEYPMAADKLQPAKLADGTYGIEYSFCHELPFKHPELDIPLLITGRADMLATYADRLWVADEKTTGSYFTKDWSRQWDTRGQFSTYCWGLRKDGINVTGAYLRGVGLFKGSVKFIESQSNRSDWETETWEFQMLKKVERLLTQYTEWKKSGDHPSRYFYGAWNEACNKYFKPCQFQDLCKTKSSEKFLEAEYSQFIWLPHMQKREELSIFLESIGYES